MIEHDIRWDQRYQQYCNAFTLPEQKIRDDYYPQLVQLRDRFAGMISDES